MFCKICSLVILLLMGVSHSEEQNQQIPDLISQLPKDLQDQLDENQISVARNKSRELFQEKCEKNGGPDAFSNAENATQDLMACFNRLVDRKVLAREIEEASPNGQVDEVFKKYCAMTPKFKECASSLVGAVRPCLEEDERRNLKIVHNITNQLAEFICFKEGDRIALFIAEGGPECFESQRDAIQTCFNGTFGDGASMNVNDVTLDNLPRLVFGKEECGKLVSLQACVVSALDNCEQPTSANIVDSLFNFVRKATPCKELVENNKPDGAWTARGALSLLAGGAALALLM